MIVWGNHGALYTPYNFSILAEVIAPIKTSAATALARRCAPSAYNRWNRIDG